MIPGGYPGLPEILSNPLVTIVALWMAVIKVIAAFVAHTHTHYPSDTI